MLVTVTIGVACRSARSSILGPPMALATHHTGCPAMGGNTVILRDEFQGLIALLLNFSTGRRRAAVARRVDGRLSYHLATSSPESSYRLMYTSAPDGTVSNRPSHRYPLPQTRYAGVVWDDARGVRHPRTATLRSRPGPQAASPLRSPRLRPSQFAVSIKEPCRSARRRQSAARAAAIQPLTLLVRATVAPSSPFRTPLDVALTRSPDPSRGTVGAGVESSAARALGSAFQSGSCSSTAASVSAHRRRRPNATRPASISYSTQPNAQMSARLSTGSAARLFRAHVRRRAEQQCPRACCRQPSWSATVPGRLRQSSGVELRPGRSRGS